MSDAIRSQVSEFLQSAGIAYSATYAGETIRENDWKCDEWRIALARTGGHNMSIPFFTGTGHRKQVKPMPQPPYRRNTLAYEEWEREAFKPKAPHAADVLHSLILDSSASDMSFNDWCADYGYDSDSMKAFATYQACCVIGDSLRKLFTRDELEALRDMMQDY